MDLLAPDSRSAPADGGATSPGSRARALMAVALGPLVTGYLAVAAVLALVMSIATRSEFSPSGVFLAAGPGWLAAYQVPLEIGGEPLGVLPLLPTIGVCVLVARTAAGAAQRLGYTAAAQAPILIGVIAGAHALAGGVICVLSAGSSSSADLLTALVVPALLAGLSAAAGVAGRCGLADLVRRYLDPLALHGLRAGALGFAALVTASGFTLFVATAMATSTTGQIVADLAPGAGSAIGLWLLSAGYVPNAVVMALGFVTGPGLSLGEVTVGPFSYTGGPVPAFPLLAALPEQQAAWWPVFLLLPAAAGALVGWSLRRCHEDPVARLRTVGVAGALVGFGTVVAGFLAGGRLASGPFDPVAIPLGIVSIAAFVWIALPGGLVAWFAGPRQRVRPVPAEDVDPEPEEGTEPDEGMEDVSEPEAEEVADQPETHEPAEPAEPEDTEDTEDTEQPEDSPEPEAAAKPDVAGSPAPTAAPDDTARPGGSAQPTGTAQSDAEAAEPDRAAGDTDSGKQA
ncbi:DUF6350 family protein [Prauserella oleivorans]|uniref:DUF6350 family protein n=1 Tax=Prauserella oleivorans TaxID=1478153 RepID=A0ABW5WG95_9PSEU